MDAQNAICVGSPLSAWIVNHDDGTLSISVPPILIEGMRTRLLHDYAVAAVRLADGFVDELAPRDYGHERDPSSVVTDTAVTADRVESLRERCEAVAVAHEQLDTFGWTEPRDVTLRRDRDWWLRAASAEITEVAGCVTATVEDGPRYANQEEWVERVVEWQAHLAEAVAFLGALQAA
ncbi:hypothetical protein [Capillimicrobium parvum]|uniref:Uncharacterized protein n=1 Tax=Capillimicrobium parvum TaxID=2884022 RepID=A0A9E6XVN6_9ACTN|nr:hypothetical protein [Capillimicrobium parvum]UGS35239.1 hypothetical protein DSM104329_01625 [Capillimicrobium parvum]